MSTYRAATERPRQALSAATEKVVSEENAWLRVLKNPHFWIILAIMSCGTVFYYADELPFLDSLESSLHIDFARRSVHRILSILPVAYAAFVFGLPGGITASVVIATLLLPRVFLVSLQAEEALIEVAAFFFIGAFVSWLIEVQNREKSEHRQTISSLQWTQKELRAHIEAVENEERRLSAVNAILTVLAESLDIRDILGDAMNKVRDVMRVEKSLLFLFDESKNELRLLAHHGVSEVFAAEILTIRGGEGLNGRVAATGEPVVMKDASDSTLLQTPAGKRENMQALLGVPLKTKGRVLGTLSVATSSPRVFASEEIGLAVAIGNGLGVAIENARLYQSQRQMLERLQQSEENYRGLFENATEAIFVYSPDGKIIAANPACESMTGYKREELTAMEYPVFLAPESVEAAGQAIERQIKGERGEETYELKIRKRDGSEAIVEMMPSLIVREGVPVAVQAIARDVTEQRRMQETLRFYVSQVLKAQESERLRIARELHDDTAQALTLLSRRLDSLASDGGAQGEMAKRLDGLREQTDEVLAGVRRFSQDLRPPVLDDFGLLPALKWLANGLEEQDGVSVSIRMTGEQHRLPRDIELALFRIVQEALNNIRKHAHASAVELSLEYKDGHVRLVVADNGHGFRLPKSSDLADRGKLGLIGMQERARLLGGSLDIQSTLGHGTNVVVTVPG